jgi:flavodoxin
MEVLVVYSSKTGSTKKVAEAIYESLPYKKTLSKVEDQPDFKNFDVILIGGWADRGTIDKKAMDYIGTIKNKKVAYFITLGAYPDSEHANSILEKTSKSIEEHNELMGHFICQGKIDSKITEMFEKFPVDHPLAMNDERRKMHQIASKHPDENDLSNAKNTFLALLEHKK